MTPRIAPSLLSADFARLAAEIAEVEAAGADLLHLDLMDGRFVPNLTFGPLVVRALRPTTGLSLDAHLMVADPDSLLEPMAEAGTDRLAVHVESCPHLHRTLARVRELGMRAGVAFNPATPVAALGEAVAWADFVLLMSVNPGFGGQAFIPESVAKVRRLRELIGGRDVDITVDGGVDADTVGPLVAAGATTLVAGSAVFGTADRRGAVERLRRAALGGTS